MSVSSTGIKSRLKKVLKRTCKDNGYPICTAIEAGILMFIEATPEEQAKKMRVIKACYK